MTKKTKTKKSANSRTKRKGRPGRKSIADKVHPDLNERLEFTMDRLCMGVRPVRVNLDLQEKYKLKERQAWVYVKAAEEEMASYAKEDRDKIAARLIKRTDKIVTLALARQEESVGMMLDGTEMKPVKIITAKPDYNAAAKATELQAKLTGTLITKVELTNVNHGDAAELDAKAGELRKLREASKRG